MKARKAAHGRRLSRKPGSETVDSSLVDSSAEMISVVTLVRNSPSLPIAIACKVVPDWLLFGEGSMVEGEPLFDPEEVYGR